GSPDREALGGVVWIEVDARDHRVGPTTLHVGEEVVVRGVDEGDVVDVAEHAPRASVLVAAADQGPEGAAASARAALVLLGVEVLLAPGVEGHSRGPLE